MSTNFGEYFLREEGMAVHTAYFKNLLQFFTAGGATTITEGTRCLRCTN
ncbi:hypothetical protein OL548_20615 [Lysinibacillus sp. MHQ-1]|nr:hypothetical protein OL548_20615 [Lysinibacillus sp. MHQ-1]